MVVSPGNVPIGSFQRPEVRGLRTAAKWETDG